MTKKILTVGVSGVSSENTHPAKERAKRAFSTACRRMTTGLKMTTERAESVIKMTGGADGLKNDDYYTACVATLNDEVYPELEAAHLEALEAGVSVDELVRIHIEMTRKHGP